MDVWLAATPNRFYLRHGFMHVEESEWDIYYVRPARTAGLADG